MSSLCRRQSFTFEEKKGGGRNSPKTKAKPHDCSLNFLERHDGSVDDVDALSQLRLVDGKGRGQADDVAVGGLRQQAVIAEAQAHLPRVVF